MPLIIHGSLSLLPAGRSEAKVQSLDDSASQSKRLIDQWVQWVQSMQFPRESKESWNSPLPVSRLSSPSPSGAYDDGCWNRAKPLSCYSLFLNYRTNDSRPSRAMPVVPAPQSSTLSVQLHIINGYNCEFRLSQPCMPFNPVSQETRPKCHLILILGPCGRKLEAIPSLPLAPVNVAYLLQSLDVKLNTCLASASGLSFTTVHYRSLVV